MDKSRIFLSIVSRLEEELKMLEIASKAAKDAATNEESKPENEYDTFALEASYLAGAQMQRVSETQRMIKMLKEFPVHRFPKDAPISPGALMELSVDGKPQWFLLLPFGAGISVDVDGNKVSVLTNESPLAKELRGKRAGAVLEVARAGQVREYEILQIL